MRTYDPSNPEKYLYVKEEKVLQEIQKLFDSMYLEPQILRQAIGYIKKSTNSEQGYHKQRIKELNAEHTKIQARMDKLTDLFLDSDFDKETYERKRKEFEIRRKEIVQEIENHNEADDKFVKCLISLLELASSAGKTFKGSTIEKKRNLINMVFVNLKLKGQKLDFTLRPPFDQFVKCAKTGEWWTLVDRFRQIHECRMIIIYLPVQITRF